MDYGRGQKAGRERREAGGEGFHLAIPKNTFVSCFLMGNKNFSREGGKLFFLLFLFYQVFLKQNFVNI